MSACCIRTKSEGRCGSIETTPNTTTFSPVSGGASHLPSEQGMDGYNAGPCELLCAQEQLVGVDASDMRRRRQGKWVDPPRLESREYFLAYSPQAHVSAALGFISPISTGDAHFRCLGPGSVTGNSPLGSALSENGDPPWLAGWCLLSPHGNGWTAVSHAWSSQHAVCRDL